MTTVVIPYAEARGVGHALSLAMLGDVLAACNPVGGTRVATSDGDAAALAEDAGAAVLDSIASGLADVEPGAILIVNSNVPCAVPDDLRALLAATPAGGIAAVEGPDGTTNALSISAAETYTPLNASRARAHARELGLDFVSVAIPNLADDVETEADVQRLQLRLGPRSQACLA